MIIYDDIFVNVIYLQGCLAVTYDVASISIASRVSPERTVTRRVPRIYARTKREKHFNFLVR